MPSLLGGKALFDAADIGAIRSPAAPNTDDTAVGDELAGNGQESGPDSGSVYGPGEGPSGARLYNAEWYREPSRAELAGYMPAGSPPVGWAMIACHTIADYRVENCRELGESPVGLGRARALRQAAWQFRVRPPRIGGRRLIGTWVRIRFDFVQEAE